MKGWIIDYTTLKNGERKGWSMYITAENIISAIQGADALIRANPEEYEKYVITNAGIANNMPTEQKWESWYVADPEDF